MAESLPIRDGTPAGTPAAADERTRPTSIDRHLPGSLLVAHGALDYALSADLDNALNATLADHPPQITLDLTDVWLLDASTLRQLLAFHKRAAAVGCVFRAVGVRGMVRRVMEITDTLKVLTD